MLNIIASMNVWTSVKSLQLSGSLVSVDLLELFADSLRALSTLESVHLGSMRITDIFARRVIKIGLEMPAVQEIDLKDNDILGLPVVLPSVSAATPYSVHLNLSSNRIDDANFRALCQLIPYRNWMKSLNVSDNALTDESCVALAAVLPMCSSVPSFDLRQNRKITRAGIVWLCNTSTAILCQRIADFGNHCLCRRRYTRECDGKSRRK